MQFAVPFLARVDDRTLLRHVVTIARGPAGLSFITAMIGLVLPHSAERVIAGAITGLLSTAIWKLLTYPTFFVFGLAFITTGSHAGRIFRWIGVVLGGAAFDIITAGLGVFCGILPAITIEIGWRGFFTGLYLIFVALTGLAVLRIPSRVLYGFFVPELLARRFLALGIGLALAGAASVALFTERWPELAPESSTPARTAAL